VLVADDSDVVQRAVLRLLQDAFEIVGVVSSGHELVEAAQALTPDVIVSDLSMPSLSGAEALKLLHDAGQMTPFVIMTATDWNPRKWIAMGALGVVHKFDLHLDLAAAVRSAASGEPYVSRSAKP
jgi:two-component system, NarL family, nitrate/nitrite response regulator NarL